MPIILNKDTSLHILENLKIGDFVTDGRGINGSIAQIDKLNASSGKLFKISLDSGKIFFLTFSIDRPPVNFQ